MINVDIAHFNRYLAEAKQYPYLEPDVERALALRLKENPNDDDAIKQMVKSHLRLVASMALKFKGYGLPLSELVSHGHVGLMETIPRFTLDYGVRFNTYAMWRIRASIQKYIIENWSMVKTGTTAAQKKLFFNLRKLKSAMGAFEDGDLKPEQVTQIAEQLDVAETDVVNMDRRLSGPDWSLNTPTVAGVFDSGEWQDFLVDRDIPDQEDITRAQEERRWGSEKIEKALGKLSLPQRYVFEARYLCVPPVPFGKIAEDPRFIELTPYKRKVTRARVEQYGNEAFRIVASVLAVAAQNDGRKIAPALESLAANEQKTFWDLYMGTDADKFNEALAKRLNATERRVVEALYLAPDIDPELDLSRSFGEVGRELQLTETQVEEMDAQAIIKLKRALLPQTAREVSGMKIMGWNFKPAPPVDERFRPVNSSISIATP